MKKGVHPLIATLLLGAVVAASSCGERTATEPGSIQASVDDAARHHATSARHRAHNPALVSKCRPLSPDRASRAIGRAGGTLEIGPHTLTVPPGALSRRVTIRAHIKGGQHVNLVQFGPDGLVFENPVTLTMSYANCDTDDEEDEAPALQIAVVDDTLGVVEYLPSMDDARRRTVTAAVSHFTNYAVAW